MQKTRTEVDCQRAKREVMVSLGNFFGPPSGPLDQGTVAKLSPFFEQVRNDSDFFIQKLKKDFPRQRPFQYIKGLTPCVAKEVTGAYPSGHSVLAKLFAMILSDMFPEKKLQFDQLAEQIAVDRVLSGMHHRTDIEAGASVGEHIYHEMKKSKKFQEEFQKFNK